MNGIPLFDSVPSRTSGALTLLAEGAVRKHDRLVVRTLRRVTQELVRSSSGSNSGHDSVAIQISFAFALLLSEYPLHIWSTWKTLTQRTSHSAVTKEKSY